MAVRHGYGKIAGTDALVFAYDTGDTRNSYRGEPTTNQYTNPDFSNGTTGWTFGSWDGNISYTTATVPGPSGKDITALKLTKNNTSAYSHFHQSNGGKYTTGNQYTLSAWVKGSGTLKGNSQWGGTHVNFTLTENWQYVSYTVTAPNDSNYPYWAAENITTGTVLYMAYAQSEQKSHATPFVNGTRSATQGLLDLTGNNTIDLSNVSFDSNAQMTFDGSNDVTYSGNLPQLDTFSLEVVLKPSTLAGWFLYRNTNMNYTDNRDNFIFGFSGNKLYGGVEYDPTGDDKSVISTTVLNTGKYVHGVLVHDNSTLTLRIYVNGNLEGTTVSTGQSYPYRSTNKMSIGADGGSNHGGIAGNKYFYSGDINVVKVYSRILTADEVRNNYRHYKNRFNIS